MTWNPNPGVDPQAPDESDISVAVMYTGNRADKMTVPLSATDLDLAVEPDKPWTYDVMLLDNADRYMVWPVARKHLPDTDTQVVYRMRGNVYEEIDRWDMNPFKEHLAKRVLANADGFICVTVGLATIAKRRARVEPTGVAGLAKVPAEWPTVEHSDDTLRAITLTNADYFEKAEPLVRYAHVFEQWAGTNGGRWDIYGEGLHEEWLANATEQFDHVNFKGYTDTPKDTIADYNVMFHFTELDALPNSVLEGFASGLPVVTTDFYAFTETHAPVEIVHGRDHLRETLNWLRTPRTRTKVGERNMKYCREEHSPEHIGQQYVAYFKRLLSHDRE